ncbi:MAG: hypothetical protein ACI8WT_003761 [Clostridium sp.]|jgi:hypothetical protein
MREYNDNISSHHKEYRKTGEVKSINIIVENTNKEFTPSFILALLVSTYRSSLKILTGFCDILHRVVYKLNACSLFLYSC